jgi:hypothetical protein
MWACFVFSPIKYFSATHPLQNVDSLLLPPMHDTWQMIVHFCDVANPRELILIFI